MPPKKAIKVVKPVKPSLAANVGIVLGVLQKEPTPFPPYTPTLPPIPHMVTRNAGPPARSVADAPLPAAERPSVVVEDEAGNPLENVRVRFEIISGGGQLTGFSQLTDVNGIATVGTWTLGKRTVDTGLNVLRAYAGSALPPEHPTDPKFPRLSLDFKTRV